MSGHVNKAQGSGCSCICLCLLDKSTLWGPFVPLPLKTYVSHNSRSSAYCISRPHNSGFYSFWKRVNEYMGYCVWLHRDVCCAHCLLLPITLTWGKRCCHGEMPWAMPEVRKCWVAVRGRAPIDTEMEIKTVSRSSSFQLSNLVISSCSSMLRQSLHNSQPLRGRRITTGNKLADSVVMWNLTRL